MKLEHGLLLKHEHELQVYKLFHCEFFYVLYITIIYYINGIPKVLALFSHTSGQIVDSIHSHDPG